MTFKRFEELFKSKYPDGEVVAHGKFGGTEANGKTTVIFTPYGKCYEYYGSYQEVLARLGIQALYQRDIEEAKQRLAHYKEKHGTRGYSLFIDGGDYIHDYSKEIAHLEAFLADVNANKYIII